MKRIVSLSLLCIMLIIAQTGCGQKEKKEISDSGFYLDTQCTITVYSEDEEKGKEIVADAFELCKNYEDKMSKTIKGSDVYKVNNAGGKAVSVSDETKEVIEMGIEMCEASDGKFDITVGRLTDLWDFKSDDPEVPSENDLEQAVSTVGSEKIKIRGNDVVIEGGKAKIDLGGIAKGYISGKVADFIEEQGVENAVINFGGNVVTIGKKTDGSDWNVGIQDPNAEGQQILGATKAADQAVITSGIYERKFKAGGKTYHHIIDPKTGYPVENDVEGVTLKCPRDKAGQCDAMSTICLLMGSEEGMKFIESNKEFEALFYCKDGSVKKTEGMDFEKRE